MSRRKRRRSSSRAQQLAGLEPSVRDLGRQTVRGRANDRSTVLAGSPFPKGSGDLRQVTEALQHLLKSSLYSEYVFVLVFERPPNAFRVHPHLGVRFKDQYLLICCD